jgi:hypothetical protein
VLNMLENIHISYMMRRLWGIEFPGPVFKHYMPDTQILSNVGEIRCEVNRKLYRLGLPAYVMVSIAGILPCEMLARTASMV